jgi:AraC-like DNA-binding protein
MRGTMPARPPYDPVTDGLSRRDAAIGYVEAAPPAHLAHVVHVFWELRTRSPLEQDFRYHALPDACVNLLLNLEQPAIAGVTALHTEATVLNLGTAFHYVGVQLFPGVWRGNPDELIDRYVGSPYRGPLPLVATAERLVGLSFADMAPGLTALVDHCRSQGLVAPNPLTARILGQLDTLRTVADIAALAGCSPRQLQRRLQRDTGFAPHDLLKVLRLQQSFRRHHLDVFADQSQFIHAFRRATGLTPGEYQRRYGVRSSQDVAPRAT